MEAVLQELKERVDRARASKRPLVIFGGGSKAFYGREVEGEPLEVTGYRGIVRYLPEELYITVRAGTPLSEIEAALASKNQMLAFEPPFAEAGATAGGTVAVGFSGPRRPFAGAVRDHVLGLKVLTGRGELLSFGGTVVKNVAGFDLSRLMVGALGTLGVVLEVTFRVHPRPEASLTLRRELPRERVLGAMAELQCRSLPLTGLAYEPPFLYLRLEGAEEAVAEAAGELGGEWLSGESFWQELRDLRRPFFREGSGCLWRITMPPAAPFPELEGEWLLDWGGRLRWLWTEAPAEQVFEAVAKGGGQAAFFFGPQKPDPPFSPLPENLKKILIALKRAFDPERILNRGKLDRQI